MKKNFLILFLSFLTLTSCYEDKSVVDTNIISEIEVTLPMEDNATIDVMKNEVVEIDPEIKQLNDKMPVEYQWELNQKVISTDKKLVYTAATLGSYKVRLKVTNADGSTFRYFTIRVNSPYEEGLLILGENESGEGKLSIITKDVNKLISEMPASNYEYNSFEINNPGYKIGKNPTDIAPKQTGIFISSESGVISFINAKTLELNSQISAPEFPDFKPVKLNIPDMGATSAMVITKDGKLYTIATVESVITKNFRLPSNISVMHTSYFRGTTNWVDNYFWDKSTSILYHLWNPTWDCNTGDYFADQDLLHFFTANTDVYVLTKSKTNPSQLKRTRFSMYVMHPSNGKIDILDKDDFNNANPLINEESISLVDEVNYSLIFADSRSLYKYYYSSTNIPSTPYITLDIPGTITCLAKDPTSKELYVGVYNPNASGRKGSVVVYDINNGAKKAVFEGVSDKPVKLMYKVRR